MRLEYIIFLHPNPIRLHSSTRANHLYIQASLPLRPILGPTFQRTRWHSCNQTSTVNMFMEALEESERLAKSYNINHALLIVTIKL